MLLVWGPPVRALTVECVCLAHTGMLMLLLIILVCMHHQVLHHTAVCAAKRANQLVAAAPQTAQKITPSLSFLGNLKLMCVV